jgi:uncharacterized membrane protein YhiD involved in acid resistance
MPTAPPADPLNAPLFFSSLSMAHTVGILLRMLCALVLGAVIAYRPWRRLPGSRAPRLNADTAQAQTIIAVAGALMVVVIGDSLARAFGLVGLGTFIRFRTGLKDPRDVAILFMMIGVGMACGLGLVATAAVGTLFVGTVLALFDRYGPPHQRRLRVAVQAPEPRAVQATIQQAFPDALVVDVPGTTCESKKITLTVDAAEGVDAAALLALLEQQGVAGIRSVRVDEE